MPTVPSSPCPRPRPASGVQCPSVSASVQCPRVPVHATAVRCPVWVSGVRAFPGPLCPPGVRSWRAAVGRPHGWDSRCLRGRPQCPRPASSARVRTWRSKLRRRAGPAETSAWTRRRRGRWLGNDKVDRVADRDRPDTREDRPLVGEPGCVAPGGRAGRVLGLAVDPGRRVCRLVARFGCDHRCGPDARPTRRSTVSMLQPAMLGYHQRRGTEHD